MKGHKRSTAEERMGRNVSPEEYERIRAMFVTHAEEEVEGHIDAVLKTMTDDCVYEHVPSGRRWEGLDGARAFYEELITAFSDVQWELEDIAIGPQGVLGIASMTATQHKPFCGFEGSGTVHWRIINMFTWAPEAQKFAGERMHYFGPWPPQAPADAVP